MKRKVSWKPHAPVGAEKEINSKIIIINTTCTVCKVASTKTALKKKDDSYIVSEKTVADMSGPGT
jgi:hypothetical protein